jgi:glycosyltransferase involved in cell wall biosynthesis
MLPVEVRVAVRRQMRPIRQQRAEVRQHMNLPVTLPSRRRQKGSVWAIAMVRNEEDTIGYAIDHLLRQGVDGILVANNRSTDRTEHILRDAAQDKRVHVAQDGLVAYHQAIKMTCLSEAVRRAGADFVIPFDSDELWFASDRPLADHIRSAEAPILEARIFNVFPSVNDDPSVRNPFQRLTAFDDCEHPIRNVAFRAHRLADLGDGNHWVARRGPVEPSLMVAHFPWRSRSQLASKIRHGKVAIEAGTLDREFGAHWRALGAKSEADIDRLWEALISRGPGVEELAWFPRGRQHSVCVWDWAHWRA